MESHLIWFIAAALLVGLELLSGSFYLLLFGACCALAGIVAWAGGGSMLPWAAAAGSAMIGMLLLRRWRGEKPLGSNTLYDLGQAVQVAHWHDQRRLRVRYRGTDWDAERTDDSPDQPQTLYIVGQRGNTWLVAATPPTPN